MMAGTLGVIGGSIGAAGAASDPLALVQHSAAVTVTAHATAHTKGAWTEVVASVSSDATLLILDVANVAQSAAATGTLLDLAVGGVGAEVAFLSNLPVGAAPASSETDISNWQIPLPVAVPAGARISARIQSVVAGGKTASVALGLFSGGSVTPGTLTVLGANAGTSAGVTLNTLWTEISASTAATYRHLVVVPSASDAAFAGSDNGSVDVAVGASGSEVLAGSIRVARRFSESVGCPAGAPSWALYDIFPGAAAGSRLALRRSGGVGPLDGAIIGVA